jgi:alpha-galactosidase
LYDPLFKPVKFQGLDPEKSYKVEEINLMPSGKKSFEESGKIYTGDFLMKIGLKVSSPANESSVVLEITEI